MSGNFLSIFDINKEDPNSVNLPFEKKPIDISKYKWTERPYKEISRHIVAKTSEKKKQKLLVMPGTTGKDVQVLKHYKVPSKDCSWTLVERDFLTMRTFKENAKDLHLFTQQEAVTYFQENFNRLELQGAPYDFAWFDLLGNLTYNDIYWLRDSFVTTTNSDLFFTFSLRARSSADSLFNVLKKSLSDQKISSELKIENLLKNSAKNLVRSNPISRTIAMDYAILIHWILLKYIFSWKEFDCQCYVYSDTTEMMIYHLSNFKNSTEKFEGLEPIDNLIELVNLWRSGNEDSEIASSLNLPPDIVKRWRHINGLPSKNLVPEYKMSESFMNLLQDDTVVMPSNILKLAPKILSNRLAKFNPKLKETSDVYFESVPDGLEIYSPHGRYRISIGLEEIKTSFEDDSNRAIYINPLFLHETNIEALNSVFRILFTGDEYLHPLLCHILDPECFNLSLPQKMAFMAWESSLESQEKAGTIVLPTGMGKTVLATKIVADWFDKHGTNDNCKVLFLAHQREILDQTVRAFLKHTHFELYDFGMVYEPLVSNFKDVWNSKSLKEHLNSKIIFASIQSLSDEEKLQSVNSNHFSLVVVDEFHHYKAKTYLPTINYFNETNYLLGLSATPFRGDILDPMEVFEKNCIYRFDLNKAIWGGYLTWPDWYLISDTTDYSKIIKKFKGQVTKTELKKLYPPNKIKLIIEKYREVVGKNKQTIIFCNSKEHAKQMALSFSKEGFAAEALYSGIPNKKRYSIIVQFQNKKIQILCVVGLFDEGVNVPDVEALVILRKTTSPVKIIQQFGRGLRLASKKRKITILDFIGNYDDLESIFNLGLLTGINSNQITQYLGSKQIGLDSDELPVIPSINFKFGKEIKFIIKNISDKAIKGLEKVTKKRARELRKQHNLSVSEIAKTLKVTDNKVLSWLFDMPLKEDEQTLINAIKDMLSYNLSDEEILTALNNAGSLENYSYPELKQKALSELK